MRRRSSEFDRSVCALRVAFLGSEWKTSYTSQQMYETANKYIHVSVCRKKGEKREETRQKREMREETISRATPRHLLLTKRKGVFYLHFQTVHAGILRRAQ